MSIFSSLYKASSSGFRDALKDLFHLVDALFLGLAFLGVPPGKQFHRIDRLRWTRSLLSVNRVRDFLNRVNHRGTYLSGIEVPPPLLAHRLQFVIGDPFLKLLLRELVQQDIRVRVA